MDKEKLKKTIKEKFKSVSRFAALIGMDSAHLTEQLRGGRRMTQEQYDVLVQAIEHIDNQAIPGKEITPELRLLIRNTILAKYQSISEFCRQHDLDIPWVSKVINESKFGAKKRTKYIDNLLKILELGETNK